MKPGVARDRIKAAGLARALRQPTAVSLFSGCGGFCSGVVAAGFNVLVAVEADRHAAASYRANFPNVPLHEGDVRGFLSGPKTRHRRHYGLDDVDLVFGGPPCQGFSQLGRRDPIDPRNALVLEFARAVDAIRPRVLILETVPGFLWARNAPLRNALVAALGTAGYCGVAFATPDAASYGVPQYRERVFLFGVRDDVRSGEPLTAAVARGLARRMRVRPVTVSDAIGDLPALPAARGALVPYQEDGKLSEFQQVMRASSPGVTAHDTMGISAHRSRVLALLRPGGTAFDLPPELWTAHRASRWRRLPPDLPSHAVLAHAERDLTEYVHPSENRWLTVREFARLQSFRDSFQFPASVSQRQRLRQLGNAVPPRLAEAVAGTARDILASSRPSGTGRRPGRPSDADGAQSQAARNRKWRHSGGLVTLEVPRDVRDRLRALGASTGATAADVIRAALDALAAENPA